MRPARNLRSAVRDNHAAPGIAGLALYVDGPLPSWDPINDREPAFQTPARRQISVLIETPQSSAKVISSTEALRVW